MTPELFEELAWRRLLVRGVVRQESEVLHYPKGQASTAIEIYSACQDENFNQFFYGIGYRQLIPDLSY